MTRERLTRLFCAFCLSCALCLSPAAQKSNAVEDDESFGPIVRAYLAYLRDQQEVVDDRVSRHEIDRRYYIHNSNRIRALRQMAIQIARETENDYLPELEAVSHDEFDQLFFPPVPKPSELEVGRTLEFKFRYLGAVRVGGERYYIFARLDPYEQAELRKQTEAEKKKESQAVTQSPSGEDASRPRRVSSP